MNSQEPDGDSPACPSDTDTRTLHMQALREWFHLPRFNQRDGLDDYDGDYREFDPLGEVVTAHLRHRIQRFAEEPSGDRRASTENPSAERQSPASPINEQSRQQATVRQGPRQPLAGMDSENESIRWLSRMLTDIRTATRSGAREVCAVFCSTVRPAASLERLAGRLAGAVLVMGENMSGVPGPEALLGALAMGANRVILVGHDTSSARQEALRLARAILAGLRLDPGDRLLNIGDDASVVRIDSLSAPVPLAPAPWEPVGNERDLLWQALEHLHSQVPAPPDQMPLYPGAPFGAVAVDASRCTLCMACAGACPTKALGYGSPGPQLLFKERDCNQCGRCRQVCPEQAVTLTPRICFDPRLTATARILHQEAPLCCSVCGTPFATSGMVDAVARKLATHWMYQDPAARERLTMCRDCRIRSCYASPRPEKARSSNRRDE